MKYAIYCRKSTDESSGKQTQSIPDQIKYCVEYLNNHQLKAMDKPADFSDFESEKEIRAEDNDDDISNKRIYKETRDLFIIKEQETGKVPYKRKKRRKLIERIKKGKIQGLLSYSPDRQARNILEGGELINFVDEGMIDLKYTNFHFENTASGKMMLGIWFVFSKQYSDNISESVTRGNKTTMGRGKSLGYFKYGYYRDNEDGFYKPDPDTFDIVKEAFRMKIYDHKTDKQIATWMNGRGMKRKRKGIANEINYKNLGTIRRDTFYHGRYIIGDEESNQLRDNPHYKPMISDLEYQILMDRIQGDKPKLTQKEIKEEHDEIMSIPRGMLKSEDGFSFTINLPNKKRYYTKLEELKKTNPNAKLKDVVLSNQIRYGVKNTASKQFGKEALGEELDNQIIKKLESLKVDKETYKEYVEFMQDNLHTIYLQISEQRNIINLQIGYTRKEQTDYINKNMGIEKDQAEQGIYNRKKSDFSMKLERLQTELDQLSTEERDTITEYEVFFDTMNRAGNVYKRGNYVQRRKICEIFFSNMVLDDKKRLTIAVKPIFEKLFVLNGGPDETRTRDLSSDSAAF